MNGSNSFNGYCTPLNTIPLLNETVADSLLQNDLNLMIGRYILPVVILIAFISNSSFIFMICRLTRMHTITNYYLISVAIADLIFTCITSSMYAFCTSSSRLYGNVPFRTPTACFLMFGSGYISWFASVIGVTIVSFERFIAVCYPFETHRLQSKSRNRLITGGLWITAIIMGLLSTPRYGKTLKLCVKWPDNEKYKDLPTFYQTCVPMGSEAVSIFGELMELIPFSITLILNVYFYGRIIYALSDRDIVGGDANQHSQTTQVRNQIARTLVINGLVFFLTQTPYRINNIDGLSKTISGEGLFTEVQSDTLKVISRGLLYVNSAINSFIYAFTSKYYRDGFLEAFGCSTPKKSITMSRSLETKTCDSNF